MARVNKVVTLYFEAFKQFELLTDEQAGMVLKALGRHFIDGEIINLSDPMAQVVYLSVEGAMQRQVNRYEGVSEKMKGNQNARKSKSEEPTIDV